MSSRAWDRDFKLLEFAFHTGPSASSICKQPYLFYLEDISYDATASRVVTVYKRYETIDDEKSKNFCWSKGLPRSKVKSIRVVSEPVSSKFFSVPRRQCAKLLEMKGKVLHINVSSCQLGELITAA